MGVLQFNLSALGTAVRTTLDGREPEIIHVHDWLTVQAGEALKWLFPAARLVLTMHDTTVGKNFGRLNAQQQYCASVEGWGIHTADLTIVCSDYVKRELMQHYQASAERIAIIPCGVDPESFAVDGDLPAWRETFAADGREADRLRGAPGPGEGDRVSAGGDG